MAKNIVKALSKLSNFAASPVCIWATTPWHLARTLRENLWQTLSHYSCWCGAINVVTSHLQCERTWRKKGDWGMKINECDWMGVIDLPAYPTELKRRRDCLRKIKGSALRLPPSIDQSLGANLLFNSHYYPGTKEPFLCFVLMWMCTRVASLSTRGQKDASWRCSIDMYKCTLWFTESILCHSDVCKVMPLSGRLRMVNRETCSACKRLVGIILWRVCEIGGQPSDMHYCDRVAIWCIKLLMHSSAGLVLAKQWYFDCYMSDFKRLSVGFIVGSNLHTHIFWNPLIFQSSNKMNTATILQ